LQDDSQGWKQTRPQTAGKGFSSLKSSQASNTLPFPIKAMAPSTSWPAGHPSLQGEVLLSKRGRRYLQLPVLFHVIEPVEMGWYGISSSRLNMICSDIFTPWEHQLSAISDQQENLFG
jgi:hypothetical protein